MSDYKNALTAAMTDLALDARMRIVGYGLTQPVSAGLKAGAAGTLIGVPMAQRVEGMTAENLMVGLAIGLSLKGYKPVVFFERADFLLCSLDAIVNHADKMSQMSQAQFNPAIIFRVVVGNRTKPLYTGVTHTRSYVEAMRHMVGFTVFDLDREDPSLVLAAYASAKHRQDLGVSTMIFERKDFWG
jgi:pyruvate/2-oxoglutarate/acetoin dehydrogenase E1 component